MHIQPVRLLAIFGTLVLGVATLKAQGTTPRGVTRLDSGGLRLMHGPNAVYPEAARKAGIEGTVVMQATLDAKNHVIDAKVVSGPMELRAAALKSILDDHFASDAPASRSVQLRVFFSLDKTPQRNPVLSSTLNPMTRLLLSSRPNARSYPRSCAAWCRNA